MHSQYDKCRAFVIQGDKPLRTYRGSSENQYCVCFGRRAQLKACERTDAEPEESKLTAQRLYVVSSCRIISHMAGCPSIEGRKIIGVRKSLSWYFIPQIRMKVRTFISGLRSRETGCTE